MLPANLLLQNRYRIVRPIGQGGMGAVYEAFDQRLAQTVALKQIMRGDATAFEREARLLARLRHPALPHVTDHFVDDNGQFLVMDYIAGDDLATALLRRRTFFPRADVCAWADQLLTTLVYLHSQEPPIVHRDIKPANLKLTQQNQLILLDFGLAKGHTQLTSEPQKSAAGYTLAYAAPEQIHGAGTDARSDLYAAAATLYHLLTGNQPTDAIQRALLIADGQPDPLWVATSAHRTLSPLLVTILQKALALNPANRFADASAMRTAFQAANQTETTQVAEPSVKVTERPPQHAIANNLPARLTSLVGRAEEVAELCRLLARPAVRLVTLTGAGGSGKTSLALAVAHALLSDNDGAAFSDGIYFVNLAPIQEPALVISTVAQVLGVKEEAGKPLLTSLQETVRHRRMLLVLDNFEQIVIAAPLLSELLTNCATLKLIVTSREVLRVRGEHEFLVPLLALPKLDAQAPADELGQFAAVQLFIERVRALKPAFVLDESNAAAVAEIVTRLDGLPLAIELASSHSKLLSPQAILERLQDRFKLLRSNVRDLPDRQRTLRAAIDWSYDLLTADEQTLFRRLAVFVGGRTFEAIEAVCNPPDQPALPPLGIDVLDGLTALMDKSLLYQTEGIDGEPRFLMLVTIYEYALERLNESVEAGHVYQSHAAYYLLLAEQAEPALTGSQQAFWFNRLEAEHDNIRAALHRVEQANQIEIGLRLSGAVQRFWQVRGYWAEGRQNLEKFLHFPSAVKYPIARARGLFGLGTLAIYMDDYTTAQTALLECLNLQRTLGDEKRIAHILNNLGLVAINQGNYAEAHAFHQESLAIRRALGDKVEIGYSLTNLGRIAETQGDYATARQFTEESLSLFRATGNKGGIADVLRDLGRFAYQRGDYIEAYRYEEESLTLYREIGDKISIAYTLQELGYTLLALDQADKAYALHAESLALHHMVGNKSGVASALAGQGNIAYWQNDYEEASHLFKESLAIYQELQDNNNVATLSNNLGNVLREQADYKEALALYKTSLKMKSPEHPTDIMYSLESLMGLAALQGEAERAVQLAGITVKLSTETNTQFPPRRQERFERHLMLARQSLSETNFNKAWSVGQAMTLEQAIAYALATGEER